MASTFCPLVFNNLPPIISSHHFWTIIWGISILLFQPKVLFSKLMLIVMGYGLFLIFMLITFWSSMDEWNIKMLYNEFYIFSIGISVISYFHHTKDYKSFALITKWSLIFIGITAIMSIISSSIDPMYARNLGGISNVTSIESERDAILAFKQYGGGTYSTAGAFMCLFPILIYYYKNIKISLLKKNQIVIFAIILFLALIGMQIFTNIIIALVFSIIAIFGMKKIKQSILIISLIFIISIMIPKGLYTNSLLAISSYFKEDSELNYKFRDLSIYIETGKDANEINTGTGNRAERYPMLLETFVKNPFVGCYFLSDRLGNGYKSEGAHLHWMNKLTVTGIFGFFIFLAIPYNFIKTNYRRFNYDYKFYYLIASLSILSYGFLKAIAGRETWYAFFIIIPGMYYLPLLKKERK